MQSATNFAVPNFDAHARPALIDLSAWISGLSYGAGFLLAGPAAVAHAALSNGAVVPVLVAAYVAFLATVLIIQRHMRLSLLANTFGSPQRLVTGGIFRLSRNPIYVAFFVPLASLAIISLPAAIAASALYVAAMNATVISKEERDLRAAFGAEFETYLATVPRWIF
ncbi:MAG: isoprenylcysteine carboxylmethyltransferase family protein [Hyphomicrobium sp.]|nr:isoprenylcysteine carboxylmethyltransferase family protein [Hyphomicrobium sp.]